MTQMLNPDGSQSSIDLTPTPEFYFILEAPTEDWQYIIQAKIVAKKLDDPKDAFVRVDVSGKVHPRYYLSRKKFTPAEIAKLIGFKGTDLSVFDDVEIIRLKPIGNQTDWQKPTVPYVGGA